MSSETVMLGVFGPNRQRVSGLIDQMAHYVRGQLPHWRNGLPGDLRLWLLWHFCQGLVSALNDPISGKLVALVVVRLLDQPQEYETAYLHRPGGRICYVSLAIAENKSALLAAIQALRARHGAPLKLMFERGGRSNRIRLYPWAKFGHKLEIQNVLTQST